MNKKSKKRRASKDQYLDVNLDELKEILERSRIAPLNTEEHEILVAAVETLTFLMQELQVKGTSIKRLRKMLFGAKTEKSKDVLKPFGHPPEPGEPSPGEPLKKDGAEGSSAEDPEGKQEPRSNESEQPKPKRKGHGRLGVDDYPGARKNKVPHPTLKAGDPCPKCPKGRVYPSTPIRLLRIEGLAPLLAKVYVLEQLRCNLCGERFTAPAPEGVGEERYDETAAAMIAMLKYGTGVPFNRIANLQDGMGMPVPVATQWDLVSDGSELLFPVFAELIRQAAQGDVLYNDDTVMKVLSLTEERRRQAAADEETDGRTGVFTSGIVSTKEQRKIALFFTGVQHAGENLADVLAKRSTELPPPIQMSDALSRNTPGDYKTLQANCNAHARRGFVDIVDYFPAECTHVLETMREVYKNDKIAREQQMSTEQRLAFHQRESGPLMEELKKWMKEQLDEHKVEPNSILGKAIQYMQNHWPKLTLFLEVAGAPLDSNIVERALKKAILHRKNALFYKTLNGARVGDINMSLIYTAELNDVDPFDYLVSLMRHFDRTCEKPEEWMPWNYQDTMRRLGLRMGS